VIGVAVPESAMDIAIAVMLALAAALVIWQVRAGGRRFMKREVVPVLAQTLAPLRPTRTEVDAILQELRKAKHKIGGKLRVDDLFAKLETPAQSGS
jgi:hypothetical protein